MHNEFIFNCRIGWTSPKSSSQKKWRRKKKNKDVDENSIAPTMNRVQMIDSFIGCTHDTIFCFVGFRHSDKSVNSCLVFLLGQHQNKIFHKKKKQKEKEIDYSLYQCSYSIKIIINLVFFFKVEFAVRICNWSKWLLI